MRIEHELDMSAPLDVVWGLTIDLERWPEITPTIRAVEIVGPEPVAAGTRVRLRQPGQPWRTWTVDEVEPGRRFAWSTGSPGVTMRAVHELTANDGGTTNTLIVETGGVLGSIVGRLTRRAIRRALQLENEGFRRAAEGSAGMPA